MTHLRRSRYRRLLLGAPRLAGAVHLTDLPCETTRTLLISHVVLPALGAFTEWLVEDAAQRGLRRLYFLSRDGYLMRQSAQILCEQRSLPIECRYLSCSRYALRLPLLHLNREAALDYLCRPSLQISVPRVLQRSYVTAAEQKQILRELPGPLRTAAPLTKAQLKQLRRALADSPSFWPLVRAHSEAAWPSLAAYITEQQMTDEIPFAIVDSGWLGSLQECLAAALAALGRKIALPGYYWGLYQAPAAGPYHTYLFGPHGQLRTKALWNNNVFEALFTAPHGMTLGYNAQGRPYYAPPRQSLAADVEAMVPRYMRCLASLPGRSPKKEKAAALSLLTQLMAHPTPAEARLIGSLPFYDDVIEHGHQELAPPLSPRALRRPLPPCAWPEGSLRRSASAPSHALFRYHVFQYLRYARKEALSLGLFRKPLRH